MEYNRNLRLSIKYHLSGLLVDYGYVNVYGEQEMRKAAAGTFTTGSNPFIFLVDTFVNPMETTLPFIALEVQNIGREAHELGTDGTGRQITVFIHVFGKSRGERDDISSYLQDNIGRSIPFNDYTTAGSPAAYTYPIQRTGGIEVSDVPPITNEQLQEHSLANWNIVLFKAGTIA